MIKETISADRT